MRTKDKMIADLELANYSKSTKESYLKRARAFVAFYMRPAEVLGKAEVREYLLERKKCVKVATLGVDVAALKFLYNVTLQRPEVVAGIPWPKIPKPLPDILSGSEVLQLLASIESIKHRTVLMTAYGAGLRIGEACSLCPEDIDSTRMLIKVRNAKGGRDRYVMLAKNLLEGLREYWRVTCSRKAAGTQLRGPWLFPGQKPSVHITPDAVREGLRNTLKTLNISKRVTPHVLRHSFATHLVETGVDIRTIQVILGHRSIRSTQFYTQVSSSHVARIESPLDKLGTPEGQVLG